MVRQPIGIIAGVFVGFFIVALAGGAHAADAPAPAPAPAPTGAPPPARAYDGWTGQPAPPPGPPRAPAPGYAPGFYPYPPAGPYGNGAPPAVYAYESQKKNEFLALAIEFFVPGVGSIYADHVAGALLTWATFVGGVALFVWWFSQNLQTDQYGNTTSDGSRDVWAVYLGLGLIVGGRIYGLVDSYTSAKEFNRQLRARLGMPEWASLGVVPIRTDRSVSWGPSLSFRF